MISKVNHQIRSMLQVEPNATGYRATLTVPADFILFPDHFRNNPVLPGICLVQAVLLAGAIREGKANLRLAAIKNAKFLNPVLPGARVAIDAQMHANGDDTLLIRATLSLAEKRLAQFSLVARPDALAMEGEK